jgi:acid phosphatase family membrane protein YuiD
MKVLKAIILSKIFCATFTAWALAQGIKVLIYYINYHKIDFRRLVGSGGMPSSHSAFVSCLATTIGLETSWNSPVFLLALGMALIIMSDAAGVRRAAGQQAKILNLIMEDLYQSRPIPPQRLKELLGHTPVQVLVGAVIGVAIAILFYRVIF